MKRVFDLLKLFFEQMLFAVFMWGDPDPTGGQYSTVERTHRAGCFWTSSELPFISSVPRRDPVKGHSQVSWTGVLPHLTSII